jgi:Zn finger protein HypA/HybF involved in hydrogenase expression
MTLETRESINFICPRCKEGFEFDYVGEYQLVPCPVCGTDFMTIRKGQTLLLGSFEFNQKPPKTRNKTTLLAEMR